MLLNNGAGSLADSHDYVVGKPRAAVVIADLNGDGYPELAIANDVTNAVSVLRNRGGTFAPGSTYATGRQPTFVASGDLNDDGRLDLATANAGAGTVSILLGRGDGSFQPKHDYRTGSGPFSIVIGDLNGDGKPDLASANSGSGTLSVLLNGGDGSFRPKLDYVPGPELYAGSIAIGDLNGDRRLDLAVSIVYSRNGATDLSLLINTPGLCNVQSVRGLTLLAAKHTLSRINCRVGKVGHAYSKSIKRGRVISEKPGFGAVLRKGGKVDLVISRGRK